MKKVLYTLLKVKSSVGMTFAERIIMRWLKDIPHEEYIKTLYICRDCKYIQDEGIRYENGIEIIDSLPNRQILLTPKGVEKLAELKKWYLGRMVRMSAFFLLKVAVGVAGFLASLLTILQFVEPTRQ